MRISLQPEGVSELYRKIPKDVARAYKASLNNHLLFSMKLQKLEVSVHEFPSPAGMVGSGEKGFKMLLFLNKDQLAKSYYTTAHEFAHLLFSTPFDIMQVSDEANDGSFRRSSIMRFNKDFEEYGEAFEEGCANYLAVMICRRLGFEYNEISEYEQKSIEIVKSIEERFGEPLMSDGKQFKIDALDHEGEYVSIRNGFWYSAVVADSSFVVNAFDEKTETGGFEKFCKTMDQWYCAADRHEFSSPQLDAFMKD